MHLAVASLRSVETRRSQVRATNSGISAAIDPLGEVIAHTHDDEAAVLLARLPMRTGAPTVSVRTGELIGPLAAVALGVLAAAARWRFRRERV